MSKQVRDYDFRRQDEIRAFWLSMGKPCPICDRRIWRRRGPVLAFKVCVGFMASIGFVGFVMGVAQVLGF